MINARIALDYLLLTSRYHQLHVPSNGNGSEMLHLFSLCIANANATPTIRYAYVHTPLTHVPIYDMWFRSPLLLTIYISLQKDAMWSPFSQHRDPINASNHRLECRFSSPGPCYHLYLSITIRSSRCDPFAPDWQYQKRGGSVVLRQTGEYPIFSPSILCSLRCNLTFRYVQGGRQWINGYGGDGITYCKDLGLWARRFETYFGDT